MDSRSLRAYDSSMESSVWLPVILASIALLGTVSGLPKGWKATEKAELQEGVWRFYRIEDPAHRESASEDNLVVNGARAMSGAEGIAAFLRDVVGQDGPKALEGERGKERAEEKLAAQLAMFVVRGTSRSPSAFAVKFRAASTRHEGKRVEHTSWLEVGGGLFKMTVTMSEAGAVTTALDPGVELVVMFKKGVTEPAAEATLAALGGQFRSGSDSAGGKVEFYANGPQFLVRVRSADRDDFAKRAAKDTSIVHARDADWSATKD